MRRIFPGFLQQKRAVLSLVFTLVLLVQGVLAVSSDTCMAMGGAKPAASQTMSYAMEGHDGHNMSEHAGDAAESDQGHKCPPLGCEICEGESCSQCSPFQFNALEQQVFVFSRERRPAPAKLASAQSFVISLRHWSMPPGRAPPTFFQTTKI